MNATSTTVLNTSEIVSNVEPFLWTVFGIVILAWVLFSSVLLYHWVRYGYKSSSVMLASISYFVGSGFFIFVAFVSLLLI